MEHEQNTKKRALHRIKIIQGHLKAIEKMLSEDKYCVDIIHQSQAVQKAMRKLDLFIMEDHLRHCVIEQVKNGEGEKTIAELKSLYDFDLK